jgi:hypothetical protein
MKSYPQELVIIMCVGVNFLMYLMTCSKTMIGIVYKKRNGSLSNLRLRATRLNLLQYKCLYETHFWITMITLTTYNTIILETFKSPYAAFTSIVLSISSMAVPTLIFYIRYKLTGSKVNHIHSLDTLRYYGTFTVIISTIDVLLVALIVLGAFYA